MKHSFFILILFTCFQSVSSQKLAIVPSIKSEFSGISYTKQHNKIEFQPSVLTLVFNGKVDFLITIGELTHKITFEQAALNKSFRIENKFKKPPEFAPPYGVIQISALRGFDHSIMSYGVQKIGLKKRSFLFNSKIFYSYSFGIGYGFNKTKKYYAERYQHSQGAGSIFDSYIIWESSHFRDGFGLFLKPTAGLLFVNRKGNSVCNVEVYCNKGVKKMNHFIISYRYGYSSIPDKQVEVIGQKLYSRGTTAGISVGIPIHILK